ncbi:glycosyltransferase family 4 protein [Vibrio sp. 10N.222.54.B12]|uniref:glycosyltransferase family 4 protein n=1 Tax=Vibrio sp. 10N.222.54.B12 TaxID=3229636 RepID=UPI00354DC58C
MNIVIIGPIPDVWGSKNGGGIATHVKELSIALDRKEDNNVAVLVTGGFFKSNKEVDNIKLLSFNYSSNIIKAACKSFFYALTSLFLYRSLRFSINVFFSGVKIYSNLQVITASTIHLHSLHSGAAFILIKEGFNNINVTIHSYHDLDGVTGKEFELLKKRYKDLIIDKWKYIHVSAADFSKGVEYGLFKVDDRNIIHNSVSNGVFSGDNKKYVSFVGSFIDRKRPILTIDSFLYSGSDEKLVMLGRGPLLKPLKEKFSNNSNVLFLGHVSESEVANILSDSVVLVVPSTSESFGLVYLEAVMAGAAVIGYHETIKELSNIMQLDEIERKLFVPFNSESDDFEYLGSLISKTIDLRMSYEGGIKMDSLKRKASDNFSWDSSVNKLLRLYKR